MSKPTVAILGASANRSKFGNKSLRAHLQAGWDVYPVNPKESEIEGLPAFATLSDLPAEVKEKGLDRISIYLPPGVTMQLLPDIARLHAKQVWFNPGSESPPLIKAAQALGIDCVEGCSIVDLGLSPAEFSD